MGLAFLSMGQEPVLLTPAEVAKRLRISDETVHRWARDGVLPYVALPTGLKRFRRDLIEAIERGDVPRPDLSSAATAPKEQQ